MVGFNDIQSQSSGAKRLAEQFHKLALKHAARRLDGAVASIKTQRDAQAYARRLAHLLWGLGFKLESPQNLDTRHVRAVVQWVWQRHRKAGTLSVWMTHLTKVATWLGKPRLVGKAEDHLPDVPRDLLRRSNTARVSKSATGKGLDLAALLAQADQLDARLGAMLRLEVCFGLRRKEVLKLQPHLDDRGSSLMIRPGVAKNGRPRVIMVETQAQRAALDLAKRVVGLNDHLGWPPKRQLRAGQSLMDVNAARYHHLMRKLNLTRAASGVTGHGLRAQFAEDRALALGYMPPVLGGVQQTLAFEVAAPSWALRNSRAGPAAIPDNVSWLARLKTERMGSGLVAWASVAPSVLSRSGLMGFGMAISSG